MVKILLTLSCLYLIMLSGCRMEDNELKPESPGALRPSIMVNNTMYYTTGQTVPIDVDESDYLGFIEKFIGYKEVPVENGHTNAYEAPEGAPYIEYKEGIAVLFEDEWHWFRTIDKG